jgi:hypothetical protein
MHVAPQRFCLREMRPFGLCVRAAGDPDKVSIQRAQITSGTTRVQVKDIGQGGGA